MRESARGGGRFFVLGVVLGSLAGLIIGSILAMQLGRQSLDLLRRGLWRLLNRREEIRFDLLLQ